MRAPRISVVISTNGRLQSLMKTVAALAWQRYPQFELCVVTGPREDGSAEFAGELASAGKIKTARCGVENLSVSRNMGIDLAAGDLVAFLDDDALPEPVWLEQLAPLFGPAQVAGAGGLVFQPNSREVQFRYSYCDRFGETTHISRNRSPDAAHPFRPTYPHVMGANCIFRREALAAVGGFDEEYDYYLDEADLCCRLADNGRQIVNADWAPVHHKYLAGATRDAAGVTVRRKSILKNQIYFSAKNARGHATLREIIARSQAFTEWHRRDLENHVLGGRLPQAALDAFDRDADAAWDEGLARGLADGRRTRAEFAQPEAFVAFPRRILDSAAQHVAIIQAAGLSDNYRAEELAEAGHVARVFTPAPRGTPGREGADFTASHWRHDIQEEAEFRDMAGMTIAASRDFSAAESYAAIRRAMDRVAAFHPFDEVIDLRPAGTD